MVVYYGIALVSFILAAAGLRIKPRSKVLSIVLICLSAFVYCYFAGARDLTVGTDTNGYAIHSYRVAISTDFNYFFFSSMYSIWSPLYKCLCWLSSNAFHSFFGYLFCIQAAIVAPLYLALHRGLPRYAAYGVLIYGLIFYPMSFNMMRQMIAMSFLLLAFIEANDKHLLKFAIWVAVAVCFHASAVIGAIIYPLVRFSISGVKESGGVRLFIVLVLSLLIVAFAPALLRLTDELGFYSSYTSGIHSDTAGGGLRTIVVTAAIGLLIAFMGWLFTKGHGSDSRLSLAGLVAVVAFGIICLPLSLISLWYYRVGFFFLYAAVLAVPTCAYNIRKWDSRVVFIIATTLLLALWSYDYYLIQGSHQVIPYLFSSMSL